MGKDAVLTIRLEPATKAALEAAAHADKRTVSAFVAIMLDEWAGQSKAAPAGAGAASRVKRKAG